ncbi:hypothetical protein [Cochleicola gelatinilyticus]|uniref:Uncharacterized protein n=1 Tax=Cochleicola gelatinilyticus TaxID=1763537 RepID=A0A167HN29_9FLAO|nr:hypothetical protein [Cochleicola gelatinilyticus]OAB78787.1 hypothetical protein ULVI_09400 [Cochleicola gelatinilyticus]
MAASEQTNDTIIKEEIQSILDDILKIYNQSGKRVSGEFEKGLKATYKPNEAEIEGYIYLSGRGKTQQGNKGEPYLVERIEEWIKSKGIIPIEESMSVTSLAHAIATKIHKEGTNKENHIKPYDGVITPQRIDKIIKRVSQFNVGLFIDSVNTEIAKLQKV